MTEEVVSQDIEVQIPEQDAVQQDVAPQEVTPSEIVQPVQEEKMIPQSQVSKIAAREKRLAEQKFAAELERLRAQQAQSQLRPEAGGNQGFGGMPMPTNAFELQQFLDAHVAQRLEQEDRRRLEQQASGILDQFQHKVNQAILDDPEFEEQYEDLDLESNPDLVILLNSLDNTASVIRDLANRPGQYSTILGLTRGGNIKLAQKELSKISKSIVENEKAKSQAKLAPEPLSQLKPSNVRTEGGSFSVKDLMGQPFCRG